MVRCLGCGLVYTCPRPDGASLRAYYEGVYSGRCGDAMNAAQTNQGMWYVNEVRWKAIRRHVALGPADRALDVGCGYGAFLAFLHGRTGCGIHGIDADAGSIRDNLCRDHGDLRVGALEDAGYPDGCFAFAAMLHSLEHMPDPVATLRGLRRVIRPDGWALIEVPNFRSWLRPLLGRRWFPFLLPQHLVHFEPDTLRTALSAAGFAHVAVLRAAWCPAELTTSLAPAISRVLRVDPASASSPGLRARLAGLLLAALFVLVDLPLSAALALFGRSGCLIALARVDAEVQEPAPSA